MSNNVTMYTPDGNITSVATLSDTTLALYKSTSTQRMLEGVIGDTNTQYVSGGVLLQFTVEEAFTKATLLPGWVWKMPERIAYDTRTLTQAKQYCWDKIKLSRSVAETSPFSFRNILYDANVTNISGASQMALIAQGASQPFSIEWTTYNNSVVTLNGTEMISLGITLGFRNSQVYDTARMLRVEIEAATTNTQVDAIIWPS